MSSSSNVKDCMCRCGSQAIRACGDFQGIIVSVIVCRTPEKHEQTDNYCAIGISGCCTNEADDVAEGVWDTINARPVLN
jgi:hypothetical protein